MGTTTIRVDDETHARLVELSAASDATLMDTVRAATDALERQRFADRVTRQFDVLRADPDAWADYLAEGETTSVSDGIGR
jgi:predicted transcriptional regulator